MDLYHQLSTKSYDYSYYVDTHQLHQCRCYGQSWESGIPGNARAFLGLPDLSGKAGKRHKFSALPDVPGNPGNARDILTGNAGNIGIVLQFDIYRFCI